MQKVILLAPTPPPAGGIAGWTVRMMQANLDHWEVRVVDEKLIGNRGVFGQSNKKKIRDEIKRCWNIWKNLKDLLSDDEAKVVHSCIPSTTMAMLREYICAGITHRRKRKFIIHFRCTVPNTTKGKLGKFVLKRLCNRSDMIFSLNRQTSEYLEKITKTPIKLIPNFISDNEIVDSHPINDTIKTALYVGGLVEDKGAFDFIQIAEAMPDITFRLVGKGDEKFENYANEKGLKNVFFAGPKDREGVKEELKSADVFVFMTYFYGEGFSNALCEAMAAGLPCIVTDWAANRDMIETNGGFVVPVKDTDAAIKALSQMESADVRRNQSMFNLTKVKYRYAETIVVSEYVNAYDELVGDKNATC